MHPGLILRRLAWWIGCVAASASSLAQAVGPRSVGDQAYGLTTVDHLTITALDLTPTASQEFAVDANLNLTALSGGSDFMAPVRLPTGAQITRVELAGCDASDTAGDWMTAAFIRVADPDGLAETLGVITSGPGCAFWSAATIEPITVYNADYSYYVLVHFGQYGDDLKLRAVRLFWQRQIRSASPFAEFTDVGFGNDYRQAVEAVASADILKPCDIGRFCPDSPVTRAQLALALARALGLNYLYSDRSSSPD